MQKRTEANGIRDGYGLDARLMVRGLVQLLDLREDTTPGVPTCFPVLEPVTLTEPAWVLGCSTHGARAAGSVSLEFGNDTTPWTTLGRTTASVSAFGTDFVGSGTISASGFADLEAGEYDFRLCVRTETYQDANFSVPHVGITMFVLR